MINCISRWFEARIDPYPDTEPTLPKAGLFPFIRSCLNGLHGWIVALVLLSAGVGAFEGYLFKMMGQLTDWMARLTPAQLWAQKHTAIIVMLVLLAVSPLWVYVLSSIRFQTLQGNFPMRLRWNFHRLMLNQSLSFYQDEFAGRVSAKVMQTALAVRDTIMIFADMLVYVLVYFVSMGVVLVGFDRWLLLPFVLWVGLFAVALYYLLPKLKQTAMAQADARSMMSGRITDAYSNIATVKLFSHGQRESAYARSAMHEFMHTVYAQMRLVTGFEVINQTLSVTLIGGSMVLELWLWQHGQIGVGALAAAVAMALRLNGLSHWIMWETAQLFENIGTVQDGMKTLSKSHTVLDAPDAQPLAVAHGEIVFKDVAFDYGADKPLLEQFNLTIRAGEKIGLVGRSGAGKSTLVNLLLRFYDIEQGQIIIDGQDIRAVTQNSLRAHIGMVTQDTSLLHRSVRENITYGKPDADDAQVIQAAQRAQAHEFILQLTDAKGRSGYDAHVGERGVKLSGGQRQRIAIARAMLKDAPILLLDEATSALDSEVENAIQENLYQLMEGKTVIAIAHRLSTIAAMDRLVVLDAGKIIEQGTHAELLARGGLYARLWAHQSGGFLGEE